MPDFVRVKDNVSGDEYSCRIPDLSRVTVLDKPAVSPNGRPLPAKTKTTVAAKAAAKKSPNDGEPVETPKEGS